MKPQVVFTAGVTAFAVLQSAIGNYGVAFWMFMFLGAMVLNAYTFAQWEEAIALAKECAEGWERTTNKLGEAVKLLHTK